MTCFYDQNLDKINPFSTEYGPLFMCGQNVLAYNPI